jgi:hypothetical protein
MIKDRSPNNRRTPRTISPRYAQRAVAFLAIVFLFLLVCFVWAAHAKMARPELRLTTLIGECSERTINSPGGSWGFRIFDFDPTFRAA